MTRPILPPPPESQTVTVLTGLHPASALRRLSRLRRPRLLAQAARIFAAGYRREHHLRAIAGAAPACPLRALSLLLTLEAEAEALRRAGASDWSATAHVALLGAALAEGAAAGHAPALTLARGGAGA
ncbi:MAG: hypothetical protein JJU40_08490 [Rhodobacteraceae bacterium]|nr:hypothetical protein [Paracoccaceae bacterium]